MLVETIVCHTGTHATGLALKVEFSAWTNVSQMTAGNLSNISVINNKASQKVSGRSDNPNPKLLFVWCFSTIAGRLAIKKNRSLFLQLIYDFCQSCFGF